MIIQWSEEIKDPDIRAQFLQFTLKYIYPKYQKDKKDPQFIEIKKMVSDEFLNHIPSLKTEMRNNKLNQIFNEKLNK